MMHTPYVVVIKRPILNSEHTKKLHPKLSVSLGDLNCFFLKEETKPGENILRSIEDHSLSLAMVCHNLMKLTKVG